MSPSRRPTAVRPSTSSSPPPTPSRLRTLRTRPSLSPSPLVSLAPSPLETKCCSIRSSLPRTIVLPSAVTIARRRQLSSCHVAPAIPMSAFSATLRNRSPADRNRSRSCQTPRAPSTATSARLKRGPSRHPRNPTSSPDQERCAPRPPLLEFHLAWESWATIQRHPGARRAGI